MQNVQFPLILILLGCKCANSDIMTDATCSAYQSGGYCSTYAMTKEYCPLTCGICTVCSGPAPSSGCGATAVSTTAQPTTVAVVSCSDDITGCTTQLCDRKPGHYYPNCKKTCDNCGPSKQIENKPNRQPSRNVIQGTPIAPRRNRYDEHLREMYLCPEVLH